MSNFEWDALYDELAALEKETGVCLSSSPTQRVGYEVSSKLPKDAHVIPALSLSKTKDVSELHLFLGDQRGVLSWKLDGLTVVLTYQGGQLVKAVTRGDGRVGGSGDKQCQVFCQCAPSDTRAGGIDCSWGGADYL